MAMTMRIPTSPPTPQTTGAVQSGIDLGAFCQDLFTSFSRADQRRWAEVYVEGLATTPGRKSISRIAQHVVGWRADQCLQQFVNQSPWDWSPVRARLAHRLTTEIHPRAWLVQEAVFPKNGSASVGVAKQFSHTSGGVLNCQLGLAVSLVGDEGSCPVNWRLLLPRSWSGDGERRARAHLPVEERYRNRWQHLLDALDEMATDWSLPVAPVVVDSRHESPVEPLLHGLAERGLPYLVRVQPGILDGVVHRSGAGPSVAEVADLSMRRALRSGDCEVRFGSNFVGITLPEVRGRHVADARPGRGGTRRLLVEWSPRRPGAQSTWLTNVGLPRLSDVVDLISLTRSRETDLYRMGDDCGLQHFEGRSFRGWQHHVTLASVARMYHLLGRGADDGRPR